MTPSVRNISPSLRAHSIRATVATRPAGYALQPAHLGGVREPPVRRARRHFGLRHRQRARRQRWPSCTLLRRRGREVLVGRPPVVPSLRILRRQQRGAEAAQSGFVSALSGGLGVEEGEEAAVGVCGAAEQQPDGALAVPRLLQGLAQGARSRRLERRELVHQPPTHHAGAAAAASSDGSDGTAIPRDGVDPGHERR